MNDVTQEHAWPLVDLHRHLEGAVRPKTVLDVSLEHCLPMPTEALQDLEDYLHLKEPIHDLMDVLPRFNLLRQVYLDYDICRWVTMDCLQDAWDEGLDYVELRFSPYFMAEPHHLDPASVTSAVCEAWQEMERARPGASRLIVILSRTYGPELCEVELACALSHRSRGVAGIDLAGDEAHWPAGLFRDHFSRAQAAGLHRTAHAGEFAGSESVCDALESLDPERIGHGVHAADDPALMERILERGIALECCPTSNVFTRAVPSLEQHPLPLFLEKGLRATLNTDDPTLFQGVTLLHEYQVTTEQMGITSEGLERIRQNGVLAAFMSDAEREDLVRRFNEKKERP
jgi:adenosine deaminase